MSETKQTVVLVILSAAIVLPACGDDPAGSCGKVQPCGGAVVGSYNVSTACASAPPPGMDFGFNCPEAVVGTPSLTVSGTASFNDDLTYTMTTTTTVTAQVQFPPECLAPQLGGATLTCDQINMLAPLLIASMPDTLMSATCGGSGDTCTCTVTLVPRTLTESGTYTTSGNTLTTTDGTGIVSAGQYCMQGSELHFMQVDPNMPMTILADTVLTKR